jgi:DNA-binding NarL/FixJ family response regulator
MKCKSSDCDPFAVLAHFNPGSKDYHHVVLSDIRMPSMNSYEFIRKIKEASEVHMMIMSAFEMRLGTRNFIMFCQISR